MRMMDPKTKNIIVGTFSFLFVAIVVAGIGTLIYMYKQGKFDDTIIKIRTSIFGPRIESIRIDKANGIIEVQKLRVYDEAGNDVTFNTTWVATESSKWSDENAGQFLFENGGANAKFHSAGNYIDEWLLCEPAEPLSGIKSIEVAGNPSWPGRWTNTVITVYSEGGKVLKVYTVKNSDKISVNIKL